jgi:hypothetical protein
VAEHASSTPRRLARAAGMGISTLAAAASILTLGAGTAMADDILPNPAVPGSGREADGTVRESATQGEVRTANLGEPIVPAGTGDVRGTNRATPNVRAWVFSGAAGDLSACVVDGPYCAYWLDIPFQINNP